MTRGPYYRTGQEWSPLYRLRECARVTQADAAKALGISERTYRKREADLQFVLTPLLVAGFRAIASEWGQIQLDRAIANSEFPAIAAKPEGGQA